MKNFILKIVIIVMASVSAYNAQEFVSQLNFMDALGNKDSIIVGYDPLATDSLDTAFNETDIKNTPINSLLDV
ncbi:MAG: hypothetical protein ABIP51_08260, partial [Bacteroidia bacterium]